MPSPTEPGNAAVVALAPALYAAAFVAGVALDAVWPLGAVSQPVGAFIGIGALLVGGALAIWANQTLRHAGTGSDPRFPTKTLVVDGPFGYSRNPLYVARTLLYVGLALVMSNGWPLITMLPLLALVDYGVIRPEENYLSSKFGGAYQRYQMSVRRWI
jgi:protein-S-isoprenylcysteine O-methyltransferase Ste14